MVKKLSFAISIIAVSSLALILTTCDGGSGTLIGDPQLVRTTFEGQQSEIAYITIPFLRKALRGHIVNAGVDFNGDGVISSYEVDGKIQEEWIVRNRLLPLTDTRFILKS